MVHLPKLTITTDGKHQTDINFTLGETICFRSLEFTADRFGSLSLSNEENVSGAVFMGMTHNGSPSLHTILEKSADEGDTTSSKGRSSDFPISQECNMMTPFIPITTTPPSEGTPTPLAIATVPLQTVAPQPDPGLTPEQ
jgi:hypothetical protein